MMDPAGIGLWLLAAASVLALFGLAGLLLVLWLGERPPLPAAGGRSEIVASDTGAAAPANLRDPTLGLRGRPDYLLQERVETQGAPEGIALLVPVEVKPSRRSRWLYEGDQVQLGAYLIALRGTYGARAALYGYVRYATGTFRVELTPALERRVTEIVALIRAGRSAAVVHRSHDIPARCVRCPVREHCDERLA